MQRHATALALVALALAAGVLGGGAALGNPTRQGAATADDVRAASGPVPRTCTRYAAPWGRDSAYGTFSRPVKTVQRLADSLRPGHTGCLRGGTYAETSEGWALRLKRGGRAGAPITIRSYPGERAKIVGTVYVPSRSDFVTLSRLDIEGTGDENTIKVYSAGFVVERSVITNGGRGNSCMILGNNSGDGEARSPIVRRNRFHDCGSVDNDNKDHAIYVSNASEARIVGNVFWSTAGYTIHFYPNAHDSLVAFNIIDGGEPSVRGGVLFGGNDDHASSGNVVERNVVAFSRTDNITSGWKDDVGSGNVARANCVWAARDDNIDLNDGGFDSVGNIVAPPAFVERGARDYRLRAHSRCLALMGADVAGRLGFRRVR